MGKFQSKYLLVYSPSGSGGSSTSNTKSLSFYVNMTENKVGYAAEFVARLLEERSNRLRALTRVRDGLGGDGSEGGKGRRGSKASQHWVNRCTYLTRSCFYHKNLVIFVSVAIGPTLPSRPRQYNICMHIIHEATCRTIIFILLPSKELVNTHKLRYDLFKCFLSYIVYG